MADAPDQVLGQASGLQSFWIMSTSSRKSARRRAMWLTGFVAGLATVALLVAWLNGLGQPLLDDVVPAPPPREPIVSAIDSDTCRDRPVGAQYAMVCVDSQLLNTDDPTACDPFGGPYQIVVCPDPSQIITGNTRPTLAAGAGSVILPLPPAPTSPPLSPTTTPEMAARWTATPADRAIGASAPEEDMGSPAATPALTQTPAQLPQPAPPLLDPLQSPPGPATTPAPAPTPIDAPTIIVMPTPMPTQVELNPDAATATPTLASTPSIAPDVTPTPTIEAGPTPTPAMPITLPIALPDEGYVMTGAGQQTTPGLVLTSTRLLLVRLMYNGAGSVAVSVRGASESAGRLMLQAAGLPEKSGVIDIPDAGVYFIDVSTTSGGSWTLTVSQPVPPLQTPFTAPNTSLRGWGDQATGFVRLHSGAIAIRFEHAGSGAFSVTLYDAETGRQVGSPLVQTIGPLQQTVTLPIAREGIYVFDVTATDVWSIIIQ